MGIITIWQIACWQGSFVGLLFVLRCKGGGVECVGGRNDGVGVGVAGFAGVRWKMMWRWVVKGWEGFGFDRFFLLNVGVG